MRWSLHDAGRRADLKDRLARLRPDATARWGRMSVDQMLWHLATVLSAATGRIDVPRQPSFFKRYLFKWVALYGPYPKGKAPTAPPFNARDRRFDFDAEGARLIELIDAMGAKPVDDAWPQHPAFGALSGRQWTHLQARHVDHHLKQFGV